MGSTRLEESRKRRARYKLEGRCCSCGKLNDTQSKSVCSSCMVRATEIGQETRTRRKQNGLCEHCDSPQEKGRKSCKKHLEIFRQRHSQRKQKVIDHYGSKCRCCGESRVDFLQVDHVLDDGHIHRKMVKNTIYGFLIKNKFPSGFQLLCANCNQGKKFNDGFCPHHPDVDLRVEMDRGILGAR